MYIKDICYISQPPTDIYMPTLNVKIYHCSSAVLSRQWFFKEKQ